MVFKFLIVLIFIVKVNSEEHTVVGVASGRSFCQGTLQIIPHLAELWCPAFFFQKNGPFCLEYNEYLNIPHYQTYQLN